MVCVSVCMSLCIVYVSMYVFMYVSMYVSMNVRMNVWMRDDASCPWQQVCWSASGIPAHIYPLVICYIAIENGHL